MDSLAGWHRRPDDVEETDKPLMAVALHVAADYGAVEHVGGANSVVVPWRS